MTASSKGAFTTEAIAGQRDAETLIRTMAIFHHDPDALFNLINSGIDPLDHSKAKLRGICRALQKFVEHQLEYAIR